MNHRKILITGGRQFFPIGTVLGLTSNMAVSRRRSLEKVQGSDGRWREGFYKVTGPVSFGPGDIFFVPRSLKFEWDKGVEKKELDMHYDFGEPDPEEQAVIEAGLERADIS